MNTLLRLVVTKIPSLPKLTSLFSITEPGVYSSGMPVQENRAWRRNVIRMRQLDDMARTLKALEGRLDALERGED